MPGKFFFSENEIKSKCFFLMGTCFKSKKAKLISMVGSFSFTVKRQTYRLNQNHCAKNVALCKNVAPDKTQNITQCSGAAAISLESIRLIRFHHHMGFSRSLLHSATLTDSDT